MGELAVPEKEKWIMAKFNANWIGVGMKIVSLIPVVVQAVESLKKGFSGKEKEDAAVEFAGTMLEASEFVADKDLLNDPEVAQAVRGAIAAYVNVQNVVAAVKAAKVKKDQ